QAQRREVDAAFVELSVQSSVARGVALVSEGPRHRDRSGVDDPAELIAVPECGCAFRSRRRLHLLQVRVAASDAAGTLAGLLAVGVPLVDCDGRSGPAVAEVADDQQVLVLVDTFEAGAASNAVGAEPHRVLEEPEALLRVTAVVETIGTEEQ